MNPTATQAPPQAPQPPKTARPRKPGASNEVTVLVFKDNEASRTFRVPLGWISQLGFMLGLLVFAALLSLFFAVKFYRVAHRADPSRVNDLEQELTDLRATHKALEAKLASAPAANAPTAPVVLGPAPEPGPTVTVTVTPAPEAAAPTTPLVTAAAGGSPVLFAALPAKSQNLSADAPKLPITVSKPKTSWRGKVLNVSFNLQYTNTDRGSQQGRIVVLARGPETVLAYPDGVLSRAGGPALIVPQNGEYFSVSRFREVNAELGPVTEHGRITDIEVLLLSQDGNVLYYDKLAPAEFRQPKPKPPAPTPAKPADTAADAAAPKADGDAGGASELIEPGVDQ